MGISRFERQVLVFLLFTSLVVVIDFAGIMLGEEINERNVIIFLNMLKIVMNKHR